MSPKASRKPQAGGPEVPSQEAQTLVGSSETEIQPQPQPQPQFESQPQSQPESQHQPQSESQRQSQPQPQSQAGGPESPTPLQSQASTLEDPAPTQPQRQGTSEVGPQSGLSSQSQSQSESQPKQEPSSGFQLQARLLEDPFETQAGPSEAAQLEAGALAAQTLGQLEAEAGAQKPPFRVGDQVLSLHGSLLYEAKCVRVAEAACGAATEAEAGSLTYLIHYTGWNKNWDEWVPASRVFEYSETNVRRQRELLVAHQAQLPPGKKGRGGLRARKTPGLQQRGPAPETLGAGEGAGPSQLCATTPATRRKRARAEAAAAESRAAAGVRPDVKVDIPEELKPWLVDDWELVTKHNQLFSLPARKNVDAILEDYARSRTVPGTAEEKAFAVVEVVAGIKEYFNVMLGTQLLYKFERPQYAQMLAQHPDASMSQIYGAPHLLRLFVRIGAMLAYTPLDDHSLSLLLGHLHDFVGYLAENCGALFSVGDYGEAPPEYPERAE